MTSLRTMVLAVREIGLAQMVPLAIYRFGLAVGHIRRVTPPQALDEAHAPQMRLDLFSPVAAFEGQSTYYQAVLAQAEEILEGKYRLFGGLPEDLDFTVPDANLHWTEAEKRYPGDIKLAWEPARFGWVFPLGLAYTWTGDERFAAAFWQNLETFQRLNPINCGVNWASAQEVSLRMLAGIFAAQVFQSAAESTQPRQRNLAAWLYAHARRIPPTLFYARAQNNNHLVSEAVGMYVAGLVFPQVREARRWQAAGRRWFQRAILRQIDGGGEYIQHSSNYHRLMLQLALVFSRAAELNNEPLGEEVQRKLAASIGWLWAHFDATSGRVSNLGHHDGAFLLPFGALTGADYRPTLQAASCAFLKRPILPPGLWDQLTQWLGIQAVYRDPLPPMESNESLTRVGGVREWAQLRVAHYTSRPAHADQLQADLWYGGRNILMDAGTFAYNQPDPWQNSLADARVHNAPWINAQSPMLRAGKFLWLQWDQARLLEGECLPARRVAGERYGYQRLGLLHQRRLEWLSAGAWNINDRISGNAAQPLSVQINWLLPDCPWQLDERGFRMQFPEFEVLIMADGLPRTAQIQFGVLRAGQVLQGNAHADARLGWYSPTYNTLLPAVDLQINAAASAPLEISTHILIRAQSGPKVN